MHNDKRVHICGVNSLVQVFRRLGFTPDVFQWPRCHAEAQALEQQSLYCSDPDWEAF